MDREQHTAARHSRDETGRTKLQNYWAGSKSSPGEFWWAQKGSPLKRSKGNRAILSIFQLRHPATQSPLQQLFWVCAAKFSPQATSARCGVFCRWKQDADLPAKLCCPVTISLFFIIVKALIHLVPVHGNPGCPSSPFHLVQMIY